MDRKREADRVASQRAAAERRVDVDNADRVADKQRQEIRALQRQVKALIPRVLQRLADSGYPGIEEVEVVTQRRGLGGLFGERRERVGAYRVSQYSIPESMGGPARTGNVRLLSDGRLYVGGGAVYSPERFTEEVLDGEGLGGRGFRRRSGPLSQTGLQQLVDGLSRLASD